jgi:hypothetical protein
VSGDKTAAGQPGRIETIKHTTVTGYQLAPVSYTVIAFYGGHNQSAEKAGQRRGEREDAGPHAREWCHPVRHCSECGRADHAANTFRFRKTGLSLKFRKSSTSLPVDMLVHCRE